MNRNAKVWLAKNIKMDKDYRNVLKISESDMITLMTNNSNLVYYDNHYSFLRENENEIYVQESYGTCIQANYIAFQNPDYSNKVFFGFIDEVIYENEHTTRIRFTIDVWTTWYEYWSSKACFVIREHVVDDTIGANTVPEGLETGDYIINDWDDLYYNLSLSYFICIGVSEALNLPNLDLLNRQYGGIYSGLTYYLFDSPENASKFLKAYDNLGKGEAVYAVFMIPTGLSFGNTWYTVSFGDVDDIKLSVVKTGSDAVRLLTNSPITMNSTLNGYTPKNKKLLCFPYNYLYMTNNSGSNIEYHYEDFIDNTPRFNIDGVVCVGCSIKAYPVNYKKYSAYVSGSDFYSPKEISYGLTCGKYPTCSWKSDVYTNWLTQNAVNLEVQNIQNGLSAMSSGMKGDIMGTISGVVNMASPLLQIYQHSFVPNTAKGDTNAGDITFSTNELGFKYFKMSIKEEYARIIDGYFYRQGYQINKIKVPNMAHRQNFNYVRIANEDNVAYPNNHNNICPSPKDLDEINKLFRRGITMWNNHTNLGDYSVTNDITS